MGRILAIDYGRKRVGLAVTDELNIIASALGTVHSADVISYLKRYLRDHMVECFVIGEPLKMDGRPSESERYITVFLKSLRKAFPDIRIERMDERFTSRMAARAILESGAKKKVRQNKALVDAVSATLILQSYLESLAMKS